MAVVVTLPKVVFTWSAFGTRNVAAFTDRLLRRSSTVTAPMGSAGAAMMRMEMDKNIIGHDASFIVICALFVNGRRLLSAVNRVKAPVSKVSRQNLNQVGSDYEVNVSVN